MEKHINGKIEVTERNQLIRLLTSFGMTPVDRTRINIPAPKVPNEFDQF